MLHPIRKLTFLTGLVALALALGACDPEEQGRILQYEKGTYLGQPDDELSPEAREAIRNRGRLQRGV